MKGKLHNLLNLEDNYNEAMIDSPFKELARDSFDHRLILFIGWQNMFFSWSELKIKMSYKNINSSHRYLSSWSDDIFSIYFEKMGKKYPKWKSVVNDWLGIRVLAVLGVRFHDSDFLIFYKFTIACSLFR